MLVDKSSPSEGLWGQIIDGINSFASNGQLQTLHIASLGSSKSQDALRSQEIQARGVNSLLVDYDKALLLVASADLKFKKFFRFAKGGKGIERIK